MQNAITIDVEDWYQVLYFEDVINRSQWTSFESRILENTAKLLDIFALHDVKATFFVLAWNAERHPELLKQIAAAGHEVGSHGYFHHLVYNQTPAEFEADLKKSLDIIEGITGEKVLSYRAPSFSITPESIWALEILLKHGIKYDASVLPVKRSYTGMPDSPKHPYPILTKSTTRLMEFPVSTVRFLGRDIPFAGGGYFRLIPYPIINRWIKKTNAEGKPIIAYFHPWEIDPRHPKYKMPFITNLRYGYSHYVNLSKTEQKLNTLLTDFSFVPVKNILALNKNGE